jgi:hypothetical protein
VRSRSDGLSCWRPFRRGPAARTDVPTAAAARGGERSTAGRPSGGGLAIVPYDGRASGSRSVQALPVGAALVCGCSPSGGLPGRPPHGGKTAPTATPTRVGDRSLFRTRSPWRGGARRFRRRDAELVFSSVDVRQAEELGVFAGSSAGAGGREQPNRSCSRASRWRTRIIVDARPRQLGPRRLRVSAGSSRSQASPRSIPTLLALTLGSWRGGASTRRSCPGRHEWLSGGSGSLPNRRS